MSAGIGAMVKPTALAVAAAYGLAWLLRPHRREGFVHLLVFMVGVLLVLIANVAFILLSGIGDETTGMMEQLSLYSQGTPWSQTFSLKTGIILATLLWPIAVVVGVGLLIKRSRPTDETTATGWSSAWIFVGLWLLIETVGVVLQKRVYNYHFMPLVPPLAATLGLVGWQLVRRPVPLAIALLVGLLPMSLLGLVEVKNILPGLTRGSQVQKVAAYIDDNTEPTDKVCFDPVGELSVLADRDPGARLGMLIHFLNHDDAPRHFSTELLADLEDRKPAIIVLRIEPTMQNRIDTWTQQPGLSNYPQRKADYLQAWDDYRQYVEQHYRQETEIDGLRVFRRIGDD